MKLNRISEEFRKQRILEIIEDSLLAEKERIIERLNDSNAYLMAEVRKLEEENQKIKKGYEEEVGKFQKTIAEVELVLNNETKTKNQYKHEYEQLVLKVAQITQQQEEAAALKEEQFRQTTQNLTNDILQLKRIIEEAKIRQKESNSIIDENNRIIEDAPGYF